MAVKLTDSQTQTAVGTYNPAQMTKWPEGGGTWSVGLSAGSATVKLLAWNVGLESQAETLVTFVLPVSSPGALKDGDMFDSVPVFAQYDDWKWSVVALAGGGTLQLSAVGTGV